MCVCVCACVCVCKINKLKREELLSYSMSMSS